MINSENLEKEPLLKDIKRDFTEISKRLDEIYARLKLVDQKLGAINFKNERPITRA